MSNFGPARLGSPRSRPFSPSPAGLPARPSADWGRAPARDETEDGEHVERRRPARRDDSPPRGGGRRRARSRSRSPPPRNRGGGGAYRDPARASRDSYRPLSHAQSYRPRSRSRSPYRSPSLTPPRPSPPQKRRGSTPPRPRRDPPPHVQPPPPPQPPPPQRQGSTPPRPHSPPPPPRVNNWGMNPQREQREFVHPRPAAAETRYALPAPALSNQFAPHPGPSQSQSQNRWAAPLPTPAAPLHTDRADPTTRASSPPKRVVADPTMIPTGPRSHSAAQAPRRRPGPIAPPSPPTIPTGPRGWRAAAPPPPPPGEDLVERERKREQAAKDEHDRVELKRRTVLLQRWLPKGMIKLAAVDPGTDSEIQKLRTTRLAILRPAHYEKAIAMRTAQAQLDMAKAERDVARDRVRASAGGIGGAGGVGMSASLSSTGA